MSVKNEVMMLSGCVSIDNCKPKCEPDKPRLVTPSEIKRMAARRTTVSASKANKKFTRAEINRLMASASKAPTSAVVKPIKKPGGNQTMAVFNRDQHPFMQRVREHMKERGVTMAVAMREVVRAFPQIHQDYLEATNAN